MRNIALYTAAMAGLGISSVVFAVEPSREELQQQINDLKAKVDQLQAAQQNMVTRQDVDQTVKAILQDADKRSQLFAIEGFTAGWTDGKFIIQSSDGNFLLHPWLQFQLRNTTTWGIDRKQPNNNDDIENGFEVRRLKIGIDGNAFSKDLTYAFQWQVDRKSGTPGLEDAWVKYQFSDQWAIRGGQFKDPLAHDSLVSSKRFLTNERSFTNDYFSPADNYIQGVSVVYGNSQMPLHAEAAFTDGANIVEFASVLNRSNYNQNFRDFPTNNADYGAAMRAEYLVMGDWKDYDDYTAMGTKTPLLVIGAGGDYTEIGHAGFFTHTVDAQYEHPSGLALYGAYYGKYTKDNPAGTGVTGTQDLYDWGALAQIGYMINRKWEIFGRYGYLHLDGDVVPAGFDNEVNEFTFGTNYYLHGHNAKVTLDIGYLPNGSPLSDDGAGILGNKDPDFYLRGQFQLLL